MNADNELGDRESWSTILPVRDGELFLGCIALHRGSGEHPAFGATRIEGYSSMHDALTDVLNLSSLMSQKSALAGIPYGGGKGVLFDGPQLATQEGRARVLSIYAEHVDRLRGKFITGSDAGVSQEDVMFLRTRSPHIVGVTVDPARRTAEGLLGSLFVTLAHAFDEPVIEGRTFAIQGIGKVGQAMLELIAPEAKQVIIADTDDERIRKARERFPNAHVTSPEDILFEDVDVLVPCALGGVLGAESAKRIRARAIVGSANNQLANPEAGDLLHERGILYAPDYVVNAGGLISVVHEYEKERLGATESVLDHDIAQIQSRLDNIFIESKANGIPPHRIADTIARLRIEALFPKRQARERK